MLMIMFVFVKSERNESDVLFEISLTYVAVKPEKACVFSLVTPGNVHTFQADSPEDSQNWVETLSETCNRLVLDSINTEETKEECTDTLIDIVSLSL